MIIFIALNELETKHHKRRTLELTAPNKDERKLFIDPLMFAMNPMMNPMAMHFPLNSGKKYKIQHNLHVVHGPYGMNPYMMGMGMGMMNPYMMGMMNPYMMGGMMNPYMMGGMMGGMMNPYMMGMMNPYMMMGYHPMNTFHPLHPFNPYNMYGGAFMHSQASPAEGGEEEGRKLMENENEGEDKLTEKLYEQMVQEKLDAEKGGIKVDF